MSAWPDCDPALARQAAAEAQDDEWRAGRLKLVGEIIADRALAPATQHALIELLLDPVEDAIIATADHHLAWSGRLAGRLGMTPRGARKALAELEAAGLVRREGRELHFLPDGLAERMRRGTDAPLFGREAGLGPGAAHARRLERLRDFALGEGLYATALATQRAIGRARGFAAPRPAAAPAAEDEPSPAPAAPSPPQPPAVRNAPADVMPIIRDIIFSCPDAAEIMLETMAEIRAEEEAAQAAGPPSPCETRAAPAPPGGGYSNPNARSPHPEEATEGGRLEG